MLIFIILQQLINAAQTSQGLTGDDTVIEIVNPDMNKGARTGIRRSDPSDAAILVQQSKRLLKEGDQAVQPGENEGGVINRVRGFFRKENRERWQTYVVVAILAFLILTPCIGIVAALVVNTSKGSSGAYGNSTGEMANATDAELYAIANETSIDYGTVPYNTTVIPGPSVIEKQLIFDSKLPNMFRSVKLNIKKEGEPFKDNNLYLPDTVLTRIRGFSAEESEKWGQKDEIIHSMIYINNIISNDVNIYDVYANRNIHRPRIDDILINFNVRGSIAEVVKLQRVETMSYSAYCTDPILKFGTHCVMSHPFYEKMYDVAGVEYYPHLREFSIYYKDKTKSTRAPLSIMPSNATQPMLKDSSDGNSEHSNATVAIDGNSEHSNVTLVIDDASTDSRATTEAAGLAENRTTAEAIDVVVVTGALSRIDIPPEAIIKAISQNQDLYKRGMEDDSHSTEKSPAGNATLETQFVAETVISKEHEAASASSSDVKTAGMGIARLLPVDDDKMGEYSDDNVIDIS